jgi:hypothetical protein
VGIALAAASLAVMPLLACRVAGGNRTPRPPQNRT